MLQYKFLDQEGHYFYNDIHPKINNGLKGFNNYFYCHESKFFRDNIDQYVILLNGSNSPFVQSEYEIYLFSRRDSFLSL